MVTPAQPTSRVSSAAAATTRSWVVNVGAVVTEVILGRVGSSRMGAENAEEAADTPSVWRDFLRVFRSGRHEIGLLTNPAVRAAPRVRDLRPRRPGREPFPLLAGHHVVGVAAARAPPGQRLVGRDGWRGRGTYGIGATRGPAGAVVL